MDSPFCFPEAMDKSWFQTNILITCSSPEPIPNCNQPKPRFKNRRPAKLSAAAGQPCLSPQEAQSCPALSCNLDGRATMKELRRQKSLSELEKYEVKGFMDLGFVFRKEELSLEIMSMIPGLHRLEAMEEESCREEEECKGRPYLSEVWSSNERRSGFSVISVPVFGTDMKKQLRSWAKEVAASIHRHDYAK